MTSISLTTDNEGKSQILLKFGKNFEDLRKDVELVTIWAKAQPHFPEIPSRNMIEFILVNSKFSIENTKQKLDMYYTIKSMFPQVYNKINPRLPRMKAGLDVQYIIPLPKLIDDMYRVILFKLKDNQSFDGFVQIGNLINLYEVRLQEDVIVSDVAIFDLEHLSVNHVLKSTPMHVKIAATILENIGNTCFMNSIIQCLSNTRWLLEYLRNERFIKEINTSLSCTKGALIQSFAEVIKEIWCEDASNRTINTTSLKDQIQRCAPRFMGYAQQDAQEFLCYLLEGLHEDVNRVQEKSKPILREIDEKLSVNDKAQESWSKYLRMDNSKIVDNFVGQLKSTLKCTHCGHCCVTFDPFWNLSLPIPQMTGQLQLSPCLDSFTREESLDGDEKPTCSNCKERRKCSKFFSIQKFPKILVIHLKRFSPTERFRGKLNVKVDFPLKGLNMSRYAADNMAPCKYNLYAISNHNGTTYNGHCTAYCKHPYTEHWHEYNDSKVSPISPKSLVSEEAYLLFYEQEDSESHVLFSCLI